jgi:hypothetical protein
MLVDLWCLTPLSKIGKETYVKKVTAMRNTRDEKSLQKKLPT